MNKDHYQPKSDEVTMGVGAKYEDKTALLKGEVFLTVVDTSREYDGPVAAYEDYPGCAGVPLAAIQDHVHIDNLIVMDASVLIARLLKDNVEPSFGLKFLAVGTGEGSWNPLSPPAATDTQRSLWAEIERKAFANTDFINGGGAPVAYPTKVVDYTTQFTESEAVGPLVEMGLIGGTVDANPLNKNPILPPDGPYDPTVDQTMYETLFNYLTFPVINKPATSTFTITWRITT